MQLLALGYAVMDKILLIRQLPKTNQNAESLGASYQYGGKVATASVAGSVIAVLLISRYLPRPGRGRETRR